MLREVIFFGILWDATNTSATGGPMKKRSQITKQAPQLEETIRGSVVMVSRHCGKAGCRCQKGEKHRSLYVSQSREGKTRMIYIPKRSEEEARRLTDNYRALRDALEKISEINITALTKKK